MSLVRSIVLVPVLAVVTVGIASAQQAAQPAPPQRGYIAAQAGAASGPPRSTAFAVEFGDNMHRNAQAYVTISYFEDLMRQPLRDELVALGTNLSALTGSRWVLSGRDRGVALTSGAKYLMGSSAVRPYVGAGAGIMNIRRTVTDARLGDVKAAVFNDYAVGDADLSLAPAAVTRPLVEATFGVGIVKGSTYFDLGYRYRRAYRLGGSLDFSQVSAGIGYKF